MSNEDQAKRAREAVASHAAEALGLLKEWVGINSFTHNIEGVNRLARATAQAFAPLGFQAEFVPSARPVAGDHLILSKPGEAGAATAFVSHLDTVYPPEEEQRLGFAWREDGDRIYGPGIIDIKGGTAVVWLALKALSEIRPDLYRRAAFQIFFNATEEGFHMHFGEVVRARLPADARACLVVEPEVLTDQGYTGSHRIVTARKGGGRFRIEVAGHGGHAGNAHAQGANAVRQLARVVEQAESLTDDSKEITVNVGMFHGGESPNRIPHHAKAEGDVRAYLGRHLDEAIAALRAAEQGPQLTSRDGKKQCATTVKIADILPPMEATPGALRLHALWQQAGASIGAEVAATRRGGLSDGNLFSLQWPTVDGLGAVGANMHCAEHDPATGKEAEYLHRPAFEPKTLLNLLALINLLEETP